MSAQPTVNGAQKSPVAMSLERLEKFQALSEFLKNCSDLEVLRHLAGLKLLPGAPAILEMAMLVFPDLEWFNSKSNTNVPDKITEIGYATVPVAALRDCKGPDDFPALLKEAAVYHIRVLENCHMRNKGFNGSKTAGIFKDVLNNYVAENGQRVPVILAGHAWHNDEEHLKKEWNLRLNKLTSVVRKVENLAMLARQADIIPVLNKAAGESNPKFDTLLEGFGVDNVEGLWRHNGANDAVYQMTLTFLVVFFPLLYPGTSSGYPIDPSIAGRLLKEMWKELAEYNQQVAPPGWGHEQFCHYCELADDHNAPDCPAIAAKSVKCTLCANAVGKENAKYRAKARDHHAGRCIAQYSHQTRPFPKFFMDRKPTFEMMRKLSQATAIANYVDIGKITYPFLKDEKVTVKLTLNEIADDSGPLKSSAEINQAVHITLIAELKKLRKETVNAREEAAEWKAKCEALLAQQGGQ
ncbi:hypothetical protein BDW02DRAFT_580780 [Decorospora gaudefroyi]|uniref:Uncharacterized protein n=1 Tax=Decorospora gaudefroyi TaxID=184978 RepID=A0A6A5KDA4_9PLEO|nr:hypothetical protein BDW02DRAFT_580780 [Decorospora gaudefroyi]